MVRTASASSWVTLALTFLLAPPAPVDDAASGVHWPSFRGPHATGVAEGFPTPSRWSAEEGRNIRWKTRIPGLGHSSPVVWGKRIYLTSGVRKEGEARLKVGLYGDISPVNDDAEHGWHLFAVDKETGKVLWKRIAREGVPKIKRHPKSSHANSTPAADGKHVVSFFGSEGLYCYDVDGRLLWKKDLGVLDSGYYRVRAAQWGFGSSPIIHEDKVIVQCDVQTNSFLAAFAIEDGKEIWRTPRDEVPTWSTPTVHVDEKRTQVIVNGYRHIGGYDMMTGEELWKLRGGGDIPVPTPVVGRGLIFITNAHGRMAPIYAIRTSASGDISLEESTVTGKYVAWSKSRLGNYMQTPLVYRSHLYCCNDRGILTCYAAASGEMLYRERLGAGRSGFTASAVAADGKVYLASEEGEVHVVKAGPRFEVLATNLLGETCMATPAISEGTLFFRTRGHLVAVAEAGTKSPR